MNIESYFTKNLCKNSTPSALVIGAFTFECMSTEDKHEYMKNVYRSPISPDLKYFCVSVLDPNDPIVNLYDYHGDTSSIYTISPYRSNQDFVHAVRKGEDTGNILMELLKNDFSGTYSWGENSYQYSPIYIKDTLDISKKYNLDEQQTFHFNIDLLVSSFFEVIDITNRTPIVSRRHTELCEITDLNNKHIALDYEEPITSLDVLNNLIQSLRSSQASYLILKHAAIRMPEDIEGFYNKFLKIIPDADRRRNDNSEKSLLLLQNETLFCGFSQQEDGTYHDDAIVEYIFNGYTEEIHNLCLQQKKNNIEYYNSYTDNYLVVFSKNRRFIKNISTYVEKSLFNSKSEIDLVKISAFYSGVDLPSILTETLISGLYKRVWESEYECFRSNDISDEDQNSSYDIVEKTILWCDRNQDNERFLYDAFIMFECNLSGSEENVNLIDIIIAIDGALSIASSLYSNCRDSDFTKESIYKEITRYEEPYNFAHDKNISSKIYYLIQRRKGKVESKIEFMFLVCRAINYNMGYFISKSEVSKDTRIINYSPKSSILRIEYEKNISYIDEDSKKIDYFINPVNDKYADIKKFISEEIKNSDRRINSFTEDKQSEIEEIISDSLVNISAKYNESRIQDIKATYNLILFGFSVTIISLAYIIFTRN